VWAEYPGEEIGGGELEGTIRIWAFRLDRGGERKMLLPDEPRTWTENVTPTAQAVMVILSK